MVVVNAELRWLADLGLPMRSIARLSGTSLAAVVRIPAIVNGDSTRW